MPKLEFNTHRYNDIEYDGIVLKIPISLMEDPKFADAVGEVYLRHMDIPVDSRTSIVKKNINELENFKNKKNILKANGKWE